MSETKKRKCHLPEFNAKVGLGALRGVKTIQEICRVMEFVRCKPASGKKEIHEQSNSPFEGKWGP